MKLKLAVGLVALSMMQPVLATPEKNVVKKELSVKSQIKNSGKIVKKTNRIISLSHTTRPNLNKAITALALPAAYLLIDLKKQQIIEEKSADVVRPLASITKLMTALVFKEKQHNPLCITSLGAQDIDTIKHTSSRMPKNYYLNCDKVLNTMLIASDNMSAFALSRSVNGLSRKQFIENMNSKAQLIGMKSTQFVDPAGLSHYNRSTAKDIAMLMSQAYKNSDISSISTKVGTSVVDENGKVLLFKNTNKLIREMSMKAVLSKTGYIRESGYNMAYIPQNTCGGRQLGIVVLGAKSSQERANFVYKKLKQYNCT